MKREKNPSRSNGSKLQQHDAFDGGGRDHFDLPGISSGGDQAPSTEADHARNGERGDERETESAAVGGRSFSYDLAKADW